MTMATPCGFCQIVPPAAHASFCPFKDEAVASGTTTVTTCPACGAAGYHLPTCTLSPPPRSDADASPARPIRDVIAKVIQVHYDTGIRPDAHAFADEIIAELGRYGHTVT